MRDYERYFDENKRLKQIMQVIREEKDSAIYDLNRIKH